MNPIEYTAPGRPSVYACGNCNKIHTTGEYLSGQVYRPEQVELSRQGAQLCCVCRKCSQVIDRTDNLSSLYCNACNTAVMKETTNNSPKVEHQSCQYCDGSGEVMQECPECFGSGEV